MALHTDLPIHKVAYDLLDVVVELIKNMPRDFKQSLGGELRDTCLAILVAIFRANCAKEKVPHLDTLIERTQMAVLLLRLARDKRWISPAQFARTMPLTTGIGKQAVAWRKKYTSPDSCGSRLP